MAISIIAIYSRKSKLTDKGNSIQNQIKLCKEYAQKHFTVEKFLIFEDEGYSGGNTNRPMYNKMLEDAKNRKFDILICYRLDRISRNISDFSYIVELLMNNDIDFISISENFDTSIPMGRAMMFIASVFAQLERETISERIKDNMYQLAKTGRWLGGKTPTGFKSKMVKYYDEANNTRKIYKLSPVPDDLELVKSLYTKYLELGSLTKLENWTLKNNIETRNNKPFDKSILKFILSNPVYVTADMKIYDYFSSLNAQISNKKEDFDGLHGLMVYNKHDERKTRIIKKDTSHWIVAVASHEGVISSSHWIRVQELLKNNKIKSPRAGTGKIGLITHLLRCKNCGSKMRISVSRRKSGVYYYYKCFKKEKSKGIKCSIDNLNGKAADKLVINEIKKLKFSIKNIYKQLSEINKNSLPITERDINNISKIEKNIENHKNSIKNLTIQLSKIENSTASKYIINQIEELDNKILNLKLEKENFNRNIGSSKSLNLTIENTLDLLLDFKNNIEELNFEERKELVNAIISKLEWDGTTLLVTID